MALNCWEFLKCGREPGGARAAKSGVCPAATLRIADGYLGGRNGGRACCFVTGTFCDETLQGTYREKSKDCFDCDFFRELRRVHGAAFSVPGFALHLQRRDPGAYDAFLRDAACARVAPDGRERSDEDPAGD